MKCNNCGSTLHYEPSIRGLKCDNCGFTKELPRPEEETVIEEVDFEGALKGASGDWGIERRTVTCKQCGAVTLNAPEQIAGVCPYCGSSNVLSAEDINDSIAPNAIIPFSYTKEEAIANFYKWNKWAFWAPEDFRKGRVLGNLTGVYLPYWTFDADSVTTYQGKFGYTTETSDGSSTKWYTRSGVLDKFIDDFTVSGSRRFSKDKLFKHVVTFNTNDIIPYTPEALPGFVAEKYTIGLDEAWNIAKGDLKKRLENAICKKESADCYSKMQMSTEYGNVKFRYVLVPVWLAACRYKGQSYNVVINGRDGRGNCRRPISTAKVILSIAIFIGIFTLPLILSFLFSLIMALFM